MVKNGRLDASVYENNVEYIRNRYNSMMKKDKSKFLSILTSRYGLKSATMVGKFTGRFDFSKLELIAIKNEMENFNLSEDES